MDADLRQTLSEYLTQHNTMTLATVGPDGPAAAGLFYVSDHRFRLYFLSDPAAQHAGNLTGQPRVAVTIHEDYRDWQQIQGVQLRGVARAIDSPAERLHVLRLYVQKYPFIQSFLDDPRRAGELLAHKISLSRFYQVTPDWIRWIDNRRGFSARCEFEVLPDGELVGE